MKRTIFSKKKILHFVFILSLIILSFYFFHKIANFIRDKQAVIVVLSPHLDDAVFSLGGLLGKPGQELLVATFFTQRSAKVVHTEWDRISGFSDSDQAIYERQRENNSTLSLYKATIRNYDYADFQYRKGNEDGKIKNKIIADIKSIMRSYGNRNLFIYGPATFGGVITHPDHKIVHQAMMSVARENNMSNIHFFIYEDFPYVRRFSLEGFGNLGVYLHKKYNINFLEVAIELDKRELEGIIINMYGYTSQIKAFRSLGANMEDSVGKFYRSRCKSLLKEAYACEVVYEIMPVN